MKAIRSIPLICLLAVFQPFVFGVPYNDTTGEGKEWVQEILSRRPAESSEIPGLLKIRRGSGPITDVPTKMTIQVSPASWQDVYETQPVDGQPGEVLVIKHFPDKPNEYLHTVVTDRSAPLQLTRLERTETFRPFAGSDFFIADLGLEFLHWPSQKIVEKEMRKGRSCRVIESINPHPAPGRYSRVLSWLDYETGNIILAEGYDHQGKLLKAFSIKKISRSDGRAQVKEIEIRNEQTDSRTRLEFNVEFEE